MSLDQRTHSQPSSSSSHQQAKPGHIFGLLRQISRLSEKFLETDLTGDSVDIRINNGRMRVVADPNEFQPATDVRLRVGTILKRAKWHTNNLDEPDAQIAHLLRQHGYDKNTPITHVTMSGKYELDEWRPVSWKFLRVNEYQKVEQYLSEVRKEFQAHHVKDKVEVLNRRDVFFLQFQNKGEMYSIVADEDSGIVTDSWERLSLKEAKERGVTGKKVARCKVSYRVRRPNGELEFGIDEQVEIGLPLTVGGKFFILSDSPKDSITRGLFWARIEKIYHKTIRSEVH